MSRKIQEKCIKLLLKNYHLKILSHNFNSNGLIKNVKKFGSNGTSYSHKNKWRVRLSSKPTV